MKKETLQGENYVTLDWEKRKKDLARGKQCDFGWGKTLIKETLQGEIMSLWIGKNRLCKGKIM